MLIHHLIGARDGLGEPEIDELWHPIFEENVVRFNISVNDIIDVEMLEPLYDSHSHRDIVQIGGIAELYLAMLRDNVNIVGSLEKA